MLLRNVSLYWMRICLMETQTLEGGRSRYSYLRGFAENEEMRIICVEVSSEFTQSRLTLSSYSLVPCTVPDSSIKTDSKMSFDPYRILSRLFIWLLDWNPVAVASIYIQSLNRAPWLFRFIVRGVHHMHGNNYARPSRFQPTAPSPITRIQRESNVSDNLATFRSSPSCSDERTSTSQR